MPEEEAIPADENLETFLVKSHVKMEKKMERLVSHVETEQVARNTYMEHTTTILEKVGCQLDGMQKDSIRAEMEIENNTTRMKEHVEYHNVKYEPNVWNAIKSVSNRTWYIVAVMVISVLGSFAAVGFFAFQIIMDKVGG